MPSERKNGRESVTVTAASTPRDRPNVVAGDKVGVLLPAAACVVLKQ